MPAEVSPPLVSATWACGPSCGVAAAAPGFPRRRDGCPVHLAAFPRERSGGKLTMTDADLTDFAVVVYREDDVWEAEVRPWRLRPTSTA